MSESFRAADGLRFGCPGCGSGLRFDPREQNLHCDSCGQKYQLSEIPDPSAGAADGMMDAAEYRCPQCGAAVHTSQTAVTSFCSFCGADVILSSQLTRTRRPQQIVPFRITREECEEIYRKKVAEARFAPADFGAEETISHFRPVYIPFWRYRCRSEGQVTGSGVETHNDATYHYTDTYEYSVAGNIAVSGVVYDASLAFEDETAQRLRFSVKRARPFHAACLCGFYAEAPDTDPALYSGGLAEYARNAWSKEFEKKSKLHDAKVDFPEAGYEEKTGLLLMPVWLLAHRTAGRVVYTAINGDSGEIVCDTPISTRRFGILTAEIAAVLAAALMLLQFVAFLRPRLLLGLCGLIATVAQWVIADVSKDLRYRSSHANDPTRQWMAQRETGGAKKRKPPKLRTQHPGCLWWVPVLITGVIVGVGMMLSWMNSYGVNEFLGKLVSDHAWLPKVLLGCSAVIFVASGYRARHGLDDALFVLRLLAVLVSLTAVLRPEISGDVAFYALCILLMGLTAVSLLRLNGAHNEYVSRPVPFFGKGEEA